MTVSCCAIDAVCMATEVFEGLATARLVAVVAACFSGRLMIGSMAGCVAVYGCTI